MSRRERRKKPAGTFEPRRRARRRALQALYQWQLNDDTAQAIVEQFLEEQNFEGVDEDYFETLVREVVERRDELDQALAPHVARVDASLDQMERVILRLGACELLHHIETPYRVILDEAVELAHRFGAEQAHTFVNGVLDRLAADCRKLERDAELGSG
ncbi:transcription antitermination factor NusB [Wenzhouxiangella sp. AB-CW3]|uniref:transcription antitermination factor NusB n=1 Tax=Wenzhouxiangella sp. AB-CW3 TaxID=2771012 RepID=UPI00168A6A76|nr:transcription antitermination factor NusB [Wenzhouxiangella sp. AB-CW3]QOC23414.1 transcription antitermination factor NusB [Wenzhouxiangella sp. AB-CW3]